MLYFQLFIIVCYLANKVLLLLQTNIQFFTGQMPFQSPNQQSQSTEGKNITFHGLAYPKLTWGLPTLSMTTNSSWLPWGMVAMPLISPLMPVPQQHTYYLLVFLLVSEG